MRKFIIIILITTLLLIVFYAGIFIRFPEEDYRVSYSISIEPDFSGKYSIIIPAIVTDYEEPVLNIDEYKNNDLLSISYIIINDETGINVTANKPVKIGFEIEGKNGKLSFFESINSHEINIHFLNQGRKFYIDFECHFYHSRSTYIMYGLHLDSRASYDEWINGTGFIDSKTNVISGQWNIKHGDNFPDPYICYIPPTLAIYLILIAYSVKQIKKDRNS